MSSVNKQLLEAAFYGTLSEMVNKSSEPVTNPLNSVNEDTGEEESRKESWSEAQRVQLDKAVKNVALAGRKKLPLPGFHALQGLRKAREDGWSVKDKGPANAEKYGMKFWGEVAQKVSSPDKNGTKRTPDECIDAYVSRHDPCITGTVLEKLLSARADPNIVDRVRCFVCIALSHT